MIDAKSCPHWTVVEEPGTEFVTCRNCGHIQSRKVRQAIVEARLVDQQTKRTIEISVARARFNPMPNHQWRELKKRVQEGRATSAENESFIGECYRRNEEIDEFGMGLGTLIALVPFLALIVFILQAIAD